jgi:hypothetical protein
MAITKKRTEGGSTLQTKHFSCQNNPMVHKSSGQSQERQPNNLEIRPKQAKMKLKKLLIDCFWRANFKPRLGLDGLLEHAKGMLTGLRLPQ